LAVKIRLRRMGAKKRPFYRFVAADSRSPRDGRFLENLGWYNPISIPAEVHLKEERIYEWLKDGAQPSETALSLFRKVGLWKKWELMKRGEDASALAITTQIKERPKKKRKGKKAPEVKAEAPEPGETETAEEKPPEK
jgi:small subunit ribosomal protein S16